jgi:peptidoglycan/xylan/chitin deacetylase (PgdA/CDA1 family)
MNDAVTDHAFPPWKSVLLHAYYAATLPWRTWHNHGAAAAGLAPVMILMYHRVADEHPTPWTVSNGTFARQIDWLRRHFDLISLAEAQVRLRTANDRAAVSITFDDGYAENCQAALPLLVRLRIPCTYFVATRFVVEQRPFPHDVARGLACPPNTAEQLRALADAGVELGGHTRTHADLGRIESQGDLREEIVGGARELESLSGRPVRYFAFPYGQYKNLSPAAFQVARDAGLAGVCSAYGGFNFPGDDPFHLQRFAVDDDLIRLKNWTTVDPRKLGRHPRYRYEQPAAQPAGGFARAGR